jgi:hypothetical protein
MFFQIKEIILWSRNAAKQPRRVHFAPGKVTVISGASRTGKSAVIPIIDYCLGAGTCSIPVQTIRNACEWFGVVIATSVGDKLFARREPGALRSTDDMFLLESREITEVPKRIAKNTNAEAVRRMLDELAGLSNLDFAAGDQQSGFEGRPSFRDLAAFTFQPQNIVANPDVLFFKTNTYEHREKLRKIFPYILGAITPALLAKQHELRRVQSELRRKERELKDAEDVSARWQAELRAKVSEARELGLLKTPQEENVTREQMLDVLEEIVKRTDLTLAVSSTTISDAIRELNQLESEEAKVSQELTALRRRLAEMNRIRESTTNYHQALRIQRDRLQISDWLIHNRSGDERCPICGSETDPSAGKLKELQRALRGLEEMATATVEVPAAFERELQRVQTEVSEGSEKLKAVQVRKKALTERSQEAHQRQFQAQKAERFVGNLENALELHRRLGQDAELRREVGELRKRERELQIELREQDIETRKRRALRIVNSSAERLLPLLDTERPNDPISLEINDLTLKVTGTNRDDYLSEIGSGSNWLSYHIAVMLALQQHFLALEYSPVPGFLVMDQPSQVYFPKRLAARLQDEPDDPVFRDEDVEAVQKVFKVLGRVVDMTKGKLQVIVLDHAPRDIWGKIPNVVEFEEWRNGVKLVPADWLTVA